MTPKKRQQLLKVLSDGHDHSDRVIGSRAGVSHVTVSKYRGQNPAWAHAETIGRDGKLRPRKVSMGLLHELNSTFKRLDDLLGQLRGMQDKRPVARYEGSYPNECRPAPLVTRDERLRAQARQCLIKWVTKINTSTAPFL
jgi:hypothetical protein